MRTVGSAVVVGVAAAALVLSAATPAAAHNYVVESTPAEGEVLVELPDSFSVTTNERLLEEGASGLYARDADGLYYGDGCAEVSGPTLSAAAALGDPGDYVLVYQFVSADGHTVSGEIPFSWDPAGSHDPAIGTEEPTRCGGVPEPSGSAEPAPAGAIDDEVFWIVAAVAAVGLALAIGVLVVRRRPTSRGPGGSSGS